MSLSACSILVELTEQEVSVSSLMKLLSKCTQFVIIPAFLGNILELASRFVLRTKSLSFVLSLPVVSLVYCAVHLWSRTTVSRDVHCVLLDCMICYTITLFLCV